MKSIITVTGSIVLVLTSLLNSSVSAHSGSHPVRYVAENGSAQGDCSKPSAPCASIAYAVKQSSKGDKIDVASGTYHAGEMDIFYLLNDMVAISGGFSTQDNFTKQNPGQHLTTITGIPADYREKLANKGFHLVRDAKGLPEQRLKPEYLDLLERYQKITTSVEKQLTCANGQAGEYPCFNIVL